jgi:hypothetical protein
MKKKLFRILLLALTALATLIALFYAWTDWAGARHWKAVEAALRAKGEPITITEIEPAPIPDEINFAAAPIFAEFASASNSNKPRITQIPNFTGAIRRGSSDLANAARSVNPKFAGSDEDAAHLVLAEAAKFQSVFEELRDAGKAPGTNWKLDYSKGFLMKLPHLSLLLKISQSLSAQSKAKLELHDSAGALADVELMINLADRVAPPEILITHLVRETMLGLAAYAVKFGLARHAWTPRELEALQRDLSKVSLPLELIIALRNERVLAYETLWKLDFREIAQTVGFLSNSDEPTLGERAFSAIGTLRPNGWSLEDRSLYMETIQALIEALETPVPHFPERIPTLIRTASKPRSLPERIHTPLSLLAFSVFPNTIRQTFRLQFQLDAARTACAIERYRLAHGTLPPTLDALCPEFLSKPTPDLMSGEPLHYKPGPGESYVLYSVGWNEIDDGGNAVDPKRPARKDSPDAADWVWKIDARP